MLASEGEKLTIHELDEALITVNLSTHAFHADRREQGGALDEGAAEHEEGSAKESSREVTTNSHFEPVPVDATKSSRME